MRTKTAQKPVRDFTRKIVWPGSTQLAPLPVVLVGVGDGSESAPQNLLTVAWTGIVCSTPPMIAISVRPERFSYPILQAKKEFTVNVPTAAMAGKVDFCGVASGRDVNKWERCGFTAEAGQNVAAPLVKECPMSLECKVVQSLELGAHTLFLAEIVAVHAAESLMDENGKFHLDKAGLLAYVHGHYHAVGRELGHFGFSVRKKKENAEDIRKKSGRKSAKARNKGENNG